MEHVFGVILSLHKGTPKHGEWVIACLRGAWPKLIGDRLASICRPVIFDGGQLTIEIEDTMWEKPLDSIKSDLIQRLGSVSSGLINDVCLKTAAKVDQK